jgi:hypothetical protein
MFSLYNDPLYQMNFQIDFENYGGAVPINWRRTGTGFALKQFVHHYSCSLSGLGLYIAYGDN